MIETLPKLKARILAAAVLSLAAACNVSASGQIPCVDDSSCPATYPVCKAGFCAEGASGNATVAVLGVPGKNATDPLRGTIQLQVVAKASSGVKSISLAAGTNTYAPATDSAPPIYKFSVDTTKLADGPAPFTATVTPGDTTQQAKTSAALSLTIDNTAPTLTTGSPTPTNARAGNLVKVDVTSSEPLASISGTLTLAGAAAGILAEIAPSEVAGNGRTYHLGFAVTSSTLAGVYPVAIAGRDIAGNDAVPATQSFTVRGGFSFSGMTVSGVTVISNLPAGTTGSVITASVSLPGTVGVGTALPTFTLADASGAVPRTFSGTPALTTSAGVNTWTLGNAVAASDASGTAIVTATISDLSGNVATRSANFLIDRTAPQAGAVSLTPAYVEAGDTITFTAVANKALKAAVLTTSSGETGASCLCNSGACSSSTSLTPTVTCTATVATTATSSSIAVTDTLVLTDTAGNVSAATAANQAHYTILPHPAISSFSAAAPTITGGGSTTLTAVFTGGLGAILDDKSSSAIGMVSGSTLTIAPPTTTKYSLQVTNLAGKSTVSSQVTVTVAAPPGFTGSFSVDTTSMTVGDTGTITFTGPTFATANGAFSSAVITGTPSSGSGAIANAGTNTTYVAKGDLSTAGSYTYTITASNTATTAATLTRTVTINVFAAPAVSSGTLSLSPTSITAGDAGNVTFTAPTFNSAVTSAFVATTNNATGCTTGLGTTCAFITNGATATLPKPGGGGGTVQNYFLYVLNTAGKLVQPGAQTASVTIVGVPSSSGGTFSVSPLIFTTGDGGSLTFTAPTTFTNVSTATVSGGGQSTSIAASSTATLPKPALAAGGSQVYTLTLNNSVGTQTDTSRTVTVNAVAAPSAGGSLTADTTAMTVGDTTGSVTFTAPTFVSTIGAFASVALTGTPNSGSATITNGGTNNTFVTKANLSSAGVGSYTYTVTASNTASTPATLAKPLTISVVAAPAVANGTLSASPSAIATGDVAGNITFTAPSFNTATTSAFLSTTATGATSGTAITSGGQAMIAKTGATTTYYLYLKNAVGTGAGIVTAQNVTVTATDPASFTGPFFVSASPTIKLGDSTTTITFTLPTTFTNVTATTITAPGVSFSAGTTQGTTVNLPLASNPQSTTTYTLTGTNAVSSTTPLTTTVLVGESIQGASLTGARYGAAAVLLNDGRVLVAGGSSTSDGTKPLNTAYIYDPVAGTYTATLTTMTVARYRPAAVVLSGANVGKVLIQGGSVSETKNDILDPTSTGTFATGGNISLVRCGGVGAVEVAAGVVLIAGGNDCVTTDRSSVEFAGATGNNATGTNNMSVTRRGLTATLLASGKVLLAGGNTSSATAEVMTFVAISGATSASTFASITATHARQYQTATLLASGKVLIAGGDGATVTTNTAEVYDPTSGPNGTLTATANEMTGHAINAAAIRTSKGLVLIVNGENITTGTLNTTEFYDPGNNRWAAGPALSIARTQLFAVEMARDLALVAGGTGNNTSVTTTTDVVITP